MRIVPIGILVVCFVMPFCFAQAASTDESNDDISPYLADLQAKYQEADKARNSGELVKAAKLYRASLTDDAAAINYADGAEPVKWFGALAESGNVDAQFLLGLAYSRGQTVPEDPTKAFKWFMKAALKGDADAQYEIGQAYQTGDGVKQSNSQAKVWWRKAAAQGHEHAQFKLDKMASKGD